MTVGRRLGSRGLQHRCLTSSSFCTLSMRYISSLLASFWPVASSALQGSADPLDEPMYELEGIPKSVLWSDATSKWRQAWHDDLSSLSASSCVFAKYEGAQTLLRLSAPTSWLESSKSTSKHCNDAVRTTEVPLMVEALHNCAILNCRACFPKSLFVRVAPFTSRDVLVFFLLNPHTLPPATYEPYL